MISKPLQSKATKLRHSSRTKTITLISCALVLMLAGTALADMGPKPTIHVEFTQAGAPVVLDNASTALLRCFDPATFDPEHVDGPVRPELLVNVTDADNGCIWYSDSLSWGRCEGSSCEYTYMPPRRFRIALKIQDSPVFITNVMERASELNSYFSVELGKKNPAENAIPEGVTQPKQPIIAPLDIPTDNPPVIPVEIKEEDTPRQQQIGVFAGYFVLTLLVEGLLMWLYLVLQKLSQKPVRTVII